MVCGAILVLWQNLDPRKSFNLIVPRSHLIITPPSDINFTLAGQCTMLPASVSLSSMRRRLWNRSSFISFDLNKSWLHPIKPLDFTPERKQIADKDILARGTDNKIILLSPLLITGGSRLQL